MSRLISASDSANQLIQRLDNPQATGGAINEDEIKTMRQLLQHVISIESLSANNNINISSIPYQSSNVAPVPIPKESIAEPIISQPQYFSGDRKYIVEFITQLKMVFSLQPSRFQTEKSRVVYACSYLRNAAFTWAQPLLETLNTPLEDASLNDFQLFSEKLRASFGDPDPISTAQRQLYKLSQGSQSASEYAAIFQRYSSSTRWNDEALKYHFTHGLNEDLQDELATRDMPQDFPAYVTKVIALDNQIRERRLQRQDHTRKFASHSFRSDSINRSDRNKDYHRYPTSGHQRSARNYPISLSRPTNSFTPSQQFPESSQYSRDQSRTFSKNSSDNSGPSSMEIGALHKQFFTLTVDEKKRRLEQKLCLYCGQPGHVAKVCPAKSHRAHPVPKN